MILLPFLKDKIVGVFGLGRAGNGAIDSLLGSGANVVAWDDALTPSPSPSWRGVKVEEWPWDEMSYVVLSPGIPFTHPKPHKVVTLAQKYNVPIICDIELLYLATHNQQPATRFVGITGTNGKSTTTALIGHIIKSAEVPCQVGGNIGISALALSPLPEGGIYVIETSSYQLDLLDKTRFDVAVLLNITPDHLDRHGDMEGYAKAKKRIFRNYPTHCIVGTDEPITRSIASSMKCTPISQNDSFPLGDLPFLPGAHNRQNIAAAFAACKALGLTDKAIIAGIESFKGLAHRMERVAEKNGIVFINDSKATNAEAAEKALLSFHSPIFWIAGGKAKEGGIEMLQPLFSKITHTYLIGDAAEDFVKTLAANNAPFTHCGTLDKAVAAAYEAAQKTKGATVLLSPACASFDQFKSFEQRGDVFRQLVEAL